MNLFLQFGHGMLEHSRHLIRKWGEGCVIFSPRDMTPEQMKGLSGDILECGGRTLLDPQLFLPRGTHHGMQKHSYWVDNFDTMDFFRTAKCKETIGRIAELNEIAQTEKFILPGFYCPKVNDTWLKCHELIINSAKEYEQKPLLATVCLAAEIMHSDEQVEILLNSVEQWPVSGIYLVVEHPNKEYLVEDPVWLSNLLTVVAALKLQGKQVIVGYATHQFLPLACAGADAIATGTWLNVRMFDKAKFNEPDSGATSRRKTWYYCPQTLSEYQPTFLGMAFKNGKMTFFAPSPTMNSTYADILFAGAPPDAVNFSEREAFRHYLSCLYSQCNLLSKDSYDNTYETVVMTLNQVSSNLRLAQKMGVRGRDRDFSLAIDATQVAVADLNNNMGFQLSMSW